MALSGRQRRILTSLSQGDLTWEVPGESYFTQFNERTGKQSRIHPSDLKDLQALGYIRQEIPPAELHRLAFWEITPEGTALLEQLALKPLESQRRRPVAGAGLKKSA